MKKNNILRILLIFLIVIIIYFLFYEKENYKNEYDNPKTICIVWDNKLFDSNKYGLANKIRGAIYIYQYCKKNNINFKIDATNDCSGKYFKNISNKYYNNENILDVFDSNYDDFIEKINNAFLYNNTVYVISSLINETMDDDDKEFAKYLCEPSDLLKIEVDKIIQKLPKKYGIQHVRFNDDVFKNDLNNADNDSFKNAYKYIENNYKETDVLITNSNNFKKYVKNKININTINYSNGDNLKHIGHELNCEDVENSFIDFFIICNSNYINCYTEYDYGYSSFSYVPSQIYNIPYNVYNT